VLVAIADRPDRRLAVGECLVWWSRDLLARQSLQTLRPRPATLRRHSGGLRRVCPWFSSGLVISLSRARMSPNRIWIRETTDQLRTTTAECSAPQRSTMDSSDKWFALDNRAGPIWGSRGREFKSRQPDGAKYGNCASSRRCAFPADFRAPKQVSSTPSVRTGVEPLAGPCGRCHGGALGGHRGS
jgi:hypothetical protein